MIKQKFSLLLLPALLGGMLIPATPAAAQLTLPGGATFDLFGPPGLVSDREVLLEAEDGPFTVVYGNFVLPGGAALDWHSNNGLAIITVTKGMFNEEESNGCVSLFEAGDVFFETQGDVHRIANPSATETAEALIAFVSPVGSDLVTFVPPPPAATCDPDDDPHDDDDDEVSAELEEIKAAVNANSETIAAIQTLLTRIARALSLNP